MWTAASTATWITITAGGGGAGNGTVEFSVSTNTGAPRSGIITIAGQTFTVSQAAAPCSYSIAPASQTFEAAGGAGTVAVTTGGGCAWTATSNADWLTITSHNSGPGNGTVDFAVAANAGPTRTGTLTIGGQTFTVTQGGT